MRKYQHLLEVFLKHTPETNHAVTAAQFEKANFEALAERDIDPVFRYMQSLEVHREYMEFFQIGVVRDQRSKIERVAKYVGLAMPDVPSFLESQQIESDARKEVQEREGQN
jgi:hypothetical protein